MKEMGEYMRGHSSGKHGCHGYGSYRAFWDDNLRLTIGGFVVAAAVEITWFMRIRNRGYELKVRAERGKRTVKKKWRRISSAVLYSSSYDAWVEDCCPMSVFYAGRCVSIVVATLSLRRQVYHLPLSPLAGEQKTG